MYDRLRGLLKSIILPSVYANWIGFLFTYTLQRNFRTVNFMLFISVISILCLGMRIGRVLRKALTREWKDFYKHTTLSCDICNNTNVFKNQAPQDDPNTQELLNPICAPPRAGWMKVTALGSNNINHADEACKWVEGFMLAALRVLAQIHAEKIIKGLHYNMAPCSAWGRR